MKNSIITAALMLFSFIGHAQENPAESTDKKFPVHIGNYKIEMNHLEIGKVLMGLKGLELKRHTKDDGSLSHYELAEKEILTDIENRYMQIHEISSDEDVEKAYFIIYGEDEKTDYKEQ